MENKMFCFQCQETAGGKGCTQVGVCGKKPEIAALQDLLLYVTKGLGEIVRRERRLTPQRRTASRTISLPRLRMRTSTARF